MKFRFCPHCGLAVVPRVDEAGRSRASCSRCDLVFYDFPKACAGVLILNASNQLLLARRGIDPYRGCWDVVGGFLNAFEHPESGAVREVLEETGLSIRLERLHGIWMDRYGEDGDYTINIYYIGRLLDETAVPRPMDDVAELAWFDADRLPTDIAFVNGRQSVNAWAPKGASRI